MEKAESHTCEVFRKRALAGNQQLAGERIFG